MCTASSASRTCGARASASLYTATDATPNSRQARMTRSAISPRLAMSTFLNIRARPSEGNVAVLLGRVPVPLRAQCLQGVDQTRSRVARIDDVVDVAATGSDVRMRELLPILLDLCVSRLLRIVAVVDVLAEQNLDCALRPHHRDLRRWPRHAVVAANVLR